MSDPIRQPVKYLRAELAKWDKVAKTANIRLD
jgi:hypothetical protein